MNRVKKIVTGAVCSIGLVVGIVSAMVDRGEVDLRVSSEFMEKLNGKWEGCRNVVYYDGGKIATIGIGTTGATCTIDPKKVYSDPEIASMYIKGLKIAESCVNDYIDGKNLPQREFEALVDIVYNVGCTRATLTRTGAHTQLRKAFLERRAGRCGRFYEWVYGRTPDGKLVVVQGLKNRRHEESMWCLRTD